MGKEWGRALAEGDSCSEQGERSRLKWECEKVRVREREREVGGGEVG